MDLLLPLCFFLLLVFINGKNFYGFMILLTSLGIYIKNPKIAMVFVLLWVLVFSSNKSSEYFQTNLPITEKNVSENTSLALKLKLKKSSKTYVLNMDKNNLFSDVYKQLESVSNMNLDSFRIGLKMNSGLMYYVRDTNQTINSFNMNATKENKKAKEKLIENTIMADIDAQKYKFRSMYPIPLIENNVVLEFSPKSELNELIYIIKNLTMLYDNEIIMNLLALQKITSPDLLIQIQKDSGNNLTDDTIRKLRNYGYLHPIPGFTIDDIILIITQNPQLVLTSKESTIKQMEPIKGSLNNIQKEGFEFYKNPSIINDKYYEILNLLELNTLFNVTSVKDVMDVDTKKEIDYMALLFKMNKVLTSIEINDNTESWKLKSLQNLDKNYDQYFGSTNETLLKYDIKSKIKNKLFNKKIELDKNLMVDFDLINLSNKINQQAQLNSKLYETEVEKQQKVEFEKIENLNKVGNIYEEKKNMNPELIEIDKIEKEFSNVGLDIINDLINLYGNFGEENFKNYIEFSVEENTNKYMLHKYIYYFKQTIIILTKDGRMFYVGLMFMVIALLMYFIESSK